MNKYNDQDLKILLNIYGIPHKRHFHFCEKKVPFKLYITSIVLVDNFFYEILLLYIFITYFGQKALFINFFLILQGKIQKFYITKEERKFLANNEVKEKNLE